MSMGLGENYCSETDIVPENPLKSRLITFYAYIPFVVLTQKEIIGAKNKKKFVCMFSCSVCVCIVLKNRMRLFYDKDFYLDYSTSDSISTSLPISFPLKKSNDVNPFPVGVVVVVMDLVDVVKPIYFTLAFAALHISVSYDHPHLIIIIVITHHLRAGKDV